MAKKQIQGKGWLLVWKTHNVTKKTAMKQITEYNDNHKNIEYVVIVKKKIEGKLYIYAFAKYNKRVSWRKDKWDLCGIRGIYRPARTWKILFPFMQIGNWTSKGISIPRALNKKSSLNHAINKQT